MTQENRNWAHRNGIYALTVSDDLYRLQVKDGFEAKNYGLDGKGESSPPPAVGRSLPEARIWNPYH